MNDRIYSFRYGDKVPRTIYGRMFSVLWILTGVCLIAIFTAAVTSAITVSSVDSDCKSTQGKHVSDLSGFARFDGLICLRHRTTSICPISLQYRIIRARK